MLGRLLWHWLVLALGLYLVSLVLPLGITFDRPEDLLWASLALMVINGLLRPIIVFITLPLILLSLGLFLLVINAFMLELLPHLVRGFHVPGFWAAFWGALLLSLITTVFGRWDRRVRRREVLACEAKQVGSGIGEGAEVSRVGGEAKGGEIIDI